jgi:hypothetical protein
MLVLTKQLIEDQNNLIDYIQKGYNIKNKNKKRKENKMTTYKTKIQYVSWNDRDLTSIKKAEIKKSKLENQGYTLIKTQSGLFSGLLIYRNENYLNK